MMTTTTPKQSWAILSRHARDEIMELRLQELCMDDDRVSSLVTVYNTTYISTRLVKEHQRKQQKLLLQQQQSRYTNNSNTLCGDNIIVEETTTTAAATSTNVDGENRMLIIDISRQKITDITMNYLYQLSFSVNIKDYIQQLAWGQNNPKNPIKPQTIMKNNNRYTRSNPNTTTAPGVSSTPIKKSKVTAETASKTDFFNTSTMSYRSSTSSYDSRNYRHGAANYHPTTTATTAAAHSVVDNTTTPCRSNITTNHPSTLQQQQQQQRPSTVQRNRSQQSQQQQQQASTKKNMHSNNSYNSTTNYQPCPSCHMAMRVPNNTNNEYKMYNGNGTKNILHEIHAEWQRIERVSNAIRTGTMKGCTGHNIYDIIIIGKGVAMKALQFIYNSLQYDEHSIIASQYNMPLQTLNSSFTSSSTSGIVGAQAAAAAAAVTTAANRLRMNFTGSTASSILNNTANNAFCHDSVNNTISATKAEQEQQNRRKRTIRFVTSIDPTAALNVVSTLDPTTTLIITVALSGTEETAATTKVLKAWLLQSIQQQHQTSNNGSMSSTVHNTAIQSTATTSTPTYDSSVLLSKHMILITGNDRIASITNKPESVYLIPDHTRCDAFCNFTSIVLLPLAITYGWDIAQDYLNGGHNIDQHFVSSKIRHNIPLLLALIDVWNTIYLEQSTTSSTNTNNNIGQQNPDQSPSLSIRTIQPFTQSLQYYPAFVSALEAQVCTGNSKLIETTIFPAVTTKLKSSIHDTSTKQPPKTNFDNDECDNDYDNRRRQQPQTELQQQNVIPTSYFHSISSVIIDGGLDGSSDRSYFQGGYNKQSMTSELIIPLDNQIQFQTKSSLIFSTTGGMNPARGGGLSNSYTSRLVGALHRSVVPPSNDSIHGTGTIINTQQQQQQTATKQQQQQSFDEQIQSSQDVLLCAFFAHADELAFGSRNQQLQQEHQHQQHHNSSTPMNIMNINNPLGPGQTSSSMSSSTYSDVYLSNSNSRFNSNSNHNNNNKANTGTAKSDGNRPSLLLLTSKLDAYTCGQLVALCEHRAIIKAKLYGIDPFAARQYVSSTPRMERTDHLQNELVKLMIGGASTNDKTGAINSNASVDDNDLYMNRFHNQTNNNSIDDEEEDDDDFDDVLPTVMLSTKTVLGHYSQMMTLRD
jgi:glucose-6-phosphate isomerase